jgi:hypothetical protein
MVLTCYPAAHYVFNWSSCSIHISDLINLPEAYFGSEWPTCRILWFSLVILQNIVVLVGRPAEYWDSDWFRILWFWLVVLHNIEILIGYPAKYCGSGWSSCIILRFYIIGYPAKYCGSGWSSCSILRLWSVTLCKLDLSKNCSLLLSLIVSQDIPHDSHLKYALKTFGFKLSPKAIPWWGEHFVNKYNVRGSYIKHECYKPDMSGFPPLISTF